KGQHKGVDMKDPKDFDHPKQMDADEALRRLVERAESYQHAAPPPPPQPRRTAKRRYITLAAALLLPFAVARVIVWRRQSTPSEKAGSATRSTPQSTDFVIATENQLRQISVEQVGERMVMVDRETTGRVSFNEDHLTPVFTPYAGRVLELKASKGEGVRA